MGLKCWSEDGNPASHDTVKLRLEKPSNALQGQRIEGYGSQPVRVAGSRPRGLWARSPEGLGPGPPGLEPGPPQKPPTSTIFANLLVGAWRRRLKRLLRGWGPGGKRSRPRKTRGGCKGGSRSAEREPRGSTFTTNIELKGSTSTAIRELGPMIPSVVGTLGPDSLIVVYMDPLGKD